jgi:hypothetical protein
VVAANVSPLRSLSLLLARNFNMLPGATKSLSLSLPYKTNRNWMSVLALEVSNSLSILTKSDIDTICLIFWQK